MGKKESSFKIRRKVKNFTLKFLPIGNLQEVLLLLN